MRQVILLLAIVLGIMVRTPQVCAQCFDQWEPLGSTLNDIVYAVAVMPGGDVLLGGNFTSTDGRYVARYNPNTGAIFIPQGGANGTVSSFAKLPDGDVIVGGYFGAIGGVTASRIARYNPATGVWSSLGAGVSNVGTPLVAGVEALAVLPDGDVIVGGTFNRAGGMTTNGIARYNPNTGAWSLMGSGVSGGFNPGVRAIAALPAGDVVVGGIFTQAGSTPANGIASYNPATGAWSSLGAGVAAPGYVRALAVLPSGQLVVGGVFSMAGGVAANGVARYNPTTGTWSAMGAGVIGGPLPFVGALAVLPDANMVVGGSFSTAGGVPANSIARYNSVTGAWSPLGAGVSGFPDGWSTTNVFSLVVQPTAIGDGQVFLGGNFQLANGYTSIGLARCKLNCFADFDCSGTVTIDDLFLFLNAWFTGDPTADFDSTAGVTIDDLFLYLNAWFTGCP